MQRGPLPLSILERQGKVGKGHRMTFFLTVRVSIPANKTPKKKSGDSSPCSTDSEATTDQDQNEWSSIVQIQQSRPQWLVGRLDQPSRARAATRQLGQLLSLRPRSAESKGCCQPGADSGRDPRLTASSAARVSVVTSSASG